MARRVDIRGDAFGQLTAIEYVGKYRYDNILRCVCTCGAECERRQSQLVSGRSISCGCAKVKSALANSKKRGAITGVRNPNYRHGLEGTKLLQVWKSMKDRCYNPKNIGYANYGGRGIRVCDEWREDGPAFCAWAIQSGYHEGLSIDRTDNNKGYSPDNCRWVDSAIQNSNRRSFKKPAQRTKVRCLETGQIFRSLTEASEATGARLSSISGCLHGRLKHAGGYSWAREA